MWHPLTLVVAYAALHHSANAASTLAFGPSGVCVAPPVTTVEIIPVYYSSYFPVQTVIDVFGDGNIINIYEPTTIITTATVTVTVPPTAPSSPGFNIQLQGLDAKDKRAVSYIGFSGGPSDHGIAVGSQAEAGVFEIIDNFLISDGSFIETELGVGFLEFEKTFTRPTDNSIWTANITSIELINPAFSLGNGQALFCVGSDGSVYLELTMEPSFTCMQVTLSAVPGQDVVSLCSYPIY
jgi:hypothetical protein